MMKFFTWAMPLLSLYCTSAAAERCDVNFNYGVIIDPAHVRMLEHGQTIVQINGTEQLFVNGRQANLNEEQKQLLKEFTAGIRQQVPEIVSIAIEGVDIGLKAVNNVIGSLTGENSASHQRIQEKFDELQMRLRKRFNHSDKSYYIAPQDFDDFDQIFAGQFEQEIEEIVSESIGTILVAVGEAMSNHDEENVEQRVDTFDERMENMGKNLQLEVSSKADALESKAEKFCQGLIALDQIETNMKQQIPELSDFDLIKTSHH
ncbi:YggN family protein [Colwelliaceae bacterium 6471]